MKLPYSVIGHEGGSSYQELARVKDDAGAMELARFYTRSAAITSVQVWRRERGKSLGKCIFITNRSQDGSITEQTPNNQKSTVK